MPSYVYILANKKNGTLYVGITTDLARRVWEHKNKIYKSFTKRYSIDKLVYYEVFDDIEHAIQREKAIKHWQRDWKSKKICEFNPEWDDLYESLAH